jgi:hypothetical protein
MTAAFILSLFVALFLGVWITLQTVRDHDIYALAIATWAGAVTFVV